MQNARWAVLLLGGASESDNTSTWEKAFASRLNFTGLEAFDVMFNRSDCR
jgi:hypothetical protein